MCAEPPKRDLELTSDSTGVVGLPLPESDKPVYRISLTAKVDAKGEGSGVLVLDPTVTAFDELVMFDSSTKISTRRVLGGLGKRGSGRRKPPVGRGRVKRFRRNRPPIGALTGERRGRTPSRRRHSGGVRHYGL